MMSIMVEIKIGLPGHPKILYEKKPNQEGYEIWEIL
jgi:hypothetical protein